MIHQTARGPILQKAYHPEFRSCACYPCHNHPSTEMVSVFTGITIGLFCAECAQKVLESMNAPGTAPSEAPSLDELP